MANGGISSSAKNDFNLVLLTEQFTAWLKIIAKTPSGKRIILNRERPTNVTCGVKMFSGFMFT